jgi:transcriptional regulator with XRE-family HTH domain
MTATHNEESVIEVGRRLRAQRSELGLTLRQLAEKSGVAFTTIQKIESGAISPTIGILMKIARGLEIKMTALLEEEPQACQVHFIEKKNRKRASISKQDIEVQYIAQNLIDPRMFGFHLTVGPNCGSGPDPLTHAGEEIVIGVQGTIDFIVDKDKFRVAPGDCLHFKCNVPHRWMNSGARPAKFYLMCSESELSPTPPDRI